jgi:hypothetical protein
MKKAPRRMALSDPAQQRRQCHLAAAEKLAQAATKKVTTTESKSDRVVGLDENGQRPLQPSSAKTAVPSGGRRKVAAQAATKQVYHYY